MKRPKLSDRVLPDYTRGEVIMNMVTHIVGGSLGVAALVLCVVRAALNGDWLDITGAAVYGASIITLYTISSVYHGLPPGIGKKVMQVIDHCTIYFLIAGSYTPVCMLVLEPRSGYTLLAVVWGIALGGMLIKALWITCPKWFSSIIYIAMGWACVSVFDQLLALLSQGAFLWLLAGGILYTVGGIIYALKLPVFNSLHKNFGSHEIFHLFVIGGSICHFICMYQYIL